MQIMLPTQKAVLM